MTSNCGSFDSSRICFLCQRKQVVFAKSASFFFKRVMRTFFVNTDFGDASLVTAGKLVQFCCDQNFDAKDSFTLGSFGW